MNWASNIHLHGQIIIEHGQTQGLGSDLWAHRSVRHHFETVVDEDISSIPADEANRAILNNLARKGSHVAPPGDQICCQCNWRQLVAKFVTTISRATCIIICMGNKHLYMYKYSDIMGQTCQWPITSHILKPLRGELGVEVVHQCSKKTAVECTTA